MDGGTVQVFLFSGSCCSGYGIGEMVRGVVWLSFHFLYFAVSCPGGRLFVVGFCFLILVFLGYNWHYMRFRI